MVRDILVRDLLPHVGFVEKDIENKTYVAKGAADACRYFLGYVVQRLLQVALRRRAPDDRDHFANKRLDVAGTLITSIFQTRLQVVVKEMSKWVQRNLNSGKAFTIQQIIDPKTISSGLVFVPTTLNELTCGGTHYPQAIWVLERRPRAAWRSGRASASPSIE